MVCAFSLFYAIPLFCFGYSRSILPILVMCGLKPRENFKVAKSKYTFQDLIPFDNKKNYYRQDKYKMWA